MLRLCLWKSTAGVEHLGRFNHCLRDLGMGLNLEMDIGKCAGR